MKYLRLVFALIIASLTAILTGCLAPKYVVPTPPGSNYAHLYSAGSWGVNSDIWIYPDDTFKVTDFSSLSRRIEETRSGYRHGAFHSVIDLVQSENAWKITSASLMQDMKSAARLKGEAVGVMDSSHDYLDIRFGGRAMKADFSEGYAEMLPSAKLLDGFALIVGRMVSLTRGTSRK